MATTPTPAPTPAPTTLMERIATNWKTSVGGVLSVAGIVISAFMANGSSNQKWALIASAVVAGLTGLLAKDK